MQAIMQKMGARKALEYDKELGQVEIMELIP